MGTAEQSSKSQMLKVKTETKKALIYSPYFDSVGGGERYCLTVAEYLLENNWQVDIFWNDHKEIGKIGQKLDLKIEKARVLKKKVAELSRWRKLILTFGYDLIFWLSDGSIPFLFGKRNILHFQQPVNCQDNNLICRYLNRNKLKFIDLIVCNSKFTKRFIDQKYKVESIVLYPPVDTEKFFLDKKENIILSIGRFEPTKKQDVMIEVFKRMVDEDLKDWQFVLIGSSTEGNKFLEKIKKKIGDYPVKLLVNAHFEDIQKYCAIAKIFWHAKGYGVEESKEPWLVEHFGITPVEAMSAGCVPVVYNAGGLKEIVRRGEGERWNTLDELMDKTIALVNNPKRYERYQKKAISQSVKFSKKIFCINLKRLLG